jgi:hypothetical protein
VRRHPRLDAWMLGLKRVGSPRRANSRIRHMRPQMARAVRLLRAASRLGVPGSVPAPPELIPAGARALAQGYLNRFSMPLLNGWLLPPWMRRQSDPASPLFTPRSVSNLMLNQTARNWTALGIPGAGHPVESMVDPWGLLTPVPGGPSLDWWVSVEGGALGTMAPSQFDVVQRLQGDLPVVVSAYEGDGLRVSSEAWMLPLPDGDWAAMQVILFNIADLPLRGTFRFAMRPYNPEGISPIYNIACDGNTLFAGGRPGPITWPAPESWSLSNVRSGDLFNMPPQHANMQAKYVSGARDQGSGISFTQPLHTATAQPKNLHDPHGFAHGTLNYSFNIEPWEEAEFIAILPVHNPRPRHTPSLNTLFALTPRTLSAPPEIRNSQFAIPNPQSYSRLKAATTLTWRSLLDSGMRISLPHRDLQASWEANRAHLLALHDGDEITPGPDIYHSFWFRDAAYMVHALSACGYEEAASQLLRGFVKRQRRDGAFVSHYGEWDGTGQALWAMSRHLLMHPDPALKEDLRPAIERGANWIARTLARSADGLMPPGISSEHLGPPDRYYWDSMWSLAGLEAAQAILGSELALDTVTHRLRETLNKSWQADLATLCMPAIPAAPGRRIDLGMVGSLVAWFPLDLLPPSSQLLQGTLAALEGATFHEGALFVNTGHSGWGTYLNMRVAGCRIAQGLQEGWELMRWLLAHASPTYNWPEAIHPHSLGGSAGDGHHGWASAEWLLLVRSLLFTEHRQTVTITPALPTEWLQSPGEIAVENAPTLHGPLNYTLRWGDRRTLHLDVDHQWNTPPKEMYWRAPATIARAMVDGAIIACEGPQIQIPTTAKHITIEQQV